MAPSRRRCVVSFDIPSSLPVAPRARRTAEAFGEVQNTAEVPHKIARRIDPEDALLEAVIDPVRPLVTEAGDSSGHESVSAPSLTRLPVFVDGSVDLIRNEAQDRDLAAFARSILSDKNPTGFLSGPIVES